jgi:hypothetical protein
MIKRSLKLLLRYAVSSSQLLLLLLLFAACDRRPLEVIVNEQVRVKIVVKWQVNFVNLYGSVPNGMTVMIYPSDGGAPIVRTTNADNITVKLDPDEYRMVIFNELMEEYAPYERFYDADSYDRMTFRASHFSSRSWDAGTDYAYTPEDPRIAVALDTFLITRDMVLQDTTIFMPYEEYRDNGMVNYRESERVYELPEVPWPMTVDFNVRIKIKHRQSLRTIEGNISGLADGFSLSRIVRTTETATHRFEPDRWERYKCGDDQDSTGVITTRIASFGLPYGKELVAERDSADNLLTLNLTLVNDSVIRRTFKVGKYIRYITPDGDEARIRYRQDLQNLMLELDLPDLIILPPVNGDGNTGAGFDARVDDWEDGGTIDLGGF